MQKVENKSFLYFALMVNARCRNFTFRVGIADAESRNVKYVTMIFTFCVVSEYLTTGLFVSGSTASVTFNNKPLNLVLFHKYGLFLIILKCSIKFCSNFLEKLRCRESMPYTNQCNGKMSEFQNSKFDFFFS